MRFGPIHGYPISRFPGAQLVGGDMILRVIQDTIQCVHDSYVILLGMSPTRSGYVGAQIVFACVLGTEKHVGCDFMGNIGVLIL